MDALGNNPNEVYAELEDIWENVDYEDPRTGICLTYQNWAEYFAGEFAHTIFALIVAFLFALNGRYMQIADDEFFDKWTKTIIAIEKYEIIK